MPPLIEEPVLPRHPRWEEFVARLTGPEGCNFQGERWTCHNDLRAATSILRTMGLSERGVRLSIAYFKDHGGFCDCEVVLNVGRHA